MLGISVCVLRTPQGPMLINGQYHDSRVLVYIHETESRCELLVRGAIANLFVPVVQDKPLDRWMVELNNVNLRGTLPT